MGRNCRMQLIDLALEEGLFFFSSPVETALLVPTFLGLALPWPFLAGEKASFGLVDLGNSCFWDLDDPN